MLIQSSYKRPCPIKSSSLLDRMASDIQILFRKTGSTHLSFSRELTFGPVTWAFFAGPGRHSLEENKNGGKCDSHVFKGVIPDSCGGHCPYFAKSKLEPKSLLLHGYVQMHPAVLTQSQSLPLLLGSPLSQGTCMTLTFPSKGHLDECSEKSPVRKDHQLVSAVQSCTIC